MEEALIITAKGLVVVFAVMALIAIVTEVSGRVFVKLDEKDKKRKLEQEEKEKAEKEKRKAEKAAKKKREQEEAAPSQTSEDSATKGGE